MTEEMIKTITQAEEQAAEKKRAAIEQAATIVANAEAQAARTERSSDEVCKAYRESQLKSAKAEADKRYQETLEEREKAARAACASILKNADGSVSKIVERIVSGNR
ncbi:MAG: hypothetical protein IJ514_02860 [Clostridia bacterium]|nr:hypothetical protein [Clostridia bacterium]